MDDLRDRVQGFLGALPVAHRIGLGAAGIGLIMASVVFLSWVTAPTMTVLSSGLNADDLAAVIDELEVVGVPYEIGAGGTTVMVPQDTLYATRARMAQSGVVAGVDGEGWELLDNQGIAVSQDRQDIDFQRALSGELQRTLSAMDGVRAATVHLVLPEDRLFTEQQEPTTASVLVDTARPLGDAEVEAITFLVASAVEGLTTNEITVADASGVVLHAPGDATGSSLMGKQLQQAREFEQSLAADVRGLLLQATGSTASVVVRAQMDFDTTTIETQSYDPETQVVDSEQLKDETWEGASPDVEGIVGVDGGPLPDEAANGGGTYDSSEQLTDYLVGSTVQRTEAAPGRVDGMSVAIVMDDGSLTGATVPDAGQVESLVAAALGLDLIRGDQVAITTVPFPEAPEAAPTAAAAADMLAMAPQVAGGVVLLLVAVWLFLMSRRRDDQGAPGTELTAPGAGLSQDDLQLLLQASRSDDPDVAARAERVLVAEARPTGDIPARKTKFVPPEPPDDTARREVEHLVETQPEEIANLLRGWLADAT